MDTGEGNRDTGRGTIGHGLWEKDTKTWTLGHKGMPRT